MPDVVELGRRRKDEPEPYALVPAHDDQPSRLIIARGEESSVSRRHLLLDTIADDAVRVTNLSLSEVAVLEPSGPPLTKDQMIVLRPPFRLEVGGRVLAIVLAAALEIPARQALEHPTRWPGQMVEPGVFMCRSPLCRPRRWTP